jgi:type IV pilus assembly protein PilA
MKKLEERKLNNNGFSLVELIIVIAIMAVLVGVLSPQFIKYVEQSRRSTDIQNAENIRTAILADIADGAIKTSASSAIKFYGKDDTSAPSSGVATATAIAETPTIQGSVVKLATGETKLYFYVKYDVDKGTCEVYADSGSKYLLTTSDGADNYKKGLDKDGK